MLASWKIKFFLELRSFLAIITYRRDDYKNRNHNFLFTNQNFVHDFVWDLWYKSVNRYQHLLINTSIPKTAMIINILSYATKDKIKNVKANHMYITKSRTFYLRKLPFRFKCRFWCLKYAREWLNTMTLMMRY